MKISVTQNILSTKSSNYHQDAFQNISLLHFGVHPLGYFGSYSYLENTFFLPQRKLECSCGPLAWIAVLRPIMFFFCNITYLCTGVGGARAHGSSTSPALCFLPPDRASRGSSGKAFLSFKHRVISSATRDNLTCLTPLVSIFFLLRLRTALDKSESRHCSLGDVRGTCRGPCHLDVGCESE